MHLIELLAQSSLTLVDKDAFQEAQIISCRLFGAVDYCK